MRTTEISSGSPPVFHECTSYSRQHVYCVMCVVPLIIVKEEVGEIRTDVDKVKEEQAKGTV